MNIPDGRSSLIVTDLDGTLLRTGGVLGGASRAALERLGARGDNERVIRVVATGRSLYSARLVMNESFPIDYLIFSSGAGIIEWKTGRLLHSSRLGAEEVRQAARVLMGRGLDFMVHDPVPDNHRFRYFRAKGDNPDFHRRVERYRDHCSACDDPGALGEAAQLLVVAPDGERNGPVLFDSLQRALPELKIIRTTSPLDGHSVWIEIFPVGVSKAQAAQFLKDRYNVPRERVFAIGNDYNDLDLLEWAERRLIVGNAPRELHARYMAVASNDQDGFAEAVGLWFDEG